MKVHQPTSPPPPMQGEQYQVQSMNQGHYCTKGNVKTNEEGGSTYTNINVGPKQLEATMR